MKTFESNEFSEKLLNDLLLLLESENGEKLAQEIERLHPTTIIDILFHLDQNSRGLLLQHITGLDNLSMVIAHANTELRKEIIEMIDDQRVAAVIRRLDLDDAADILSTISRRRQVKILKRLNSTLVKDLTTLLAYDAQTAGGIMNPRFFSLHPDELCSSALSRLKESLHSKEIDKDTDLSHCYVLNSENSLIGVLTLRELLAADEKQKISNIMNPDPVYVLPEADQEEAAWKIADYDLASLPVVSTEDNSVLGIITVDDILDVIKEEHEEDLSKIVGTNEEDRVSSTMAVSIKSRIPWLLASFTFGTLGALLLGNYSETLEKIVALAFFMPVVFGMGGNVGSQSSTITVRGLATGELGKTNIVSRITKELAVGLTLGLIFAILLGISSYLMFNQYKLSLVVSFSIATTMMCASTSGAILPLLFEKLGFDPAFAAGPIVTTGNDILSIIIYFTVASILL